MSRHHKKVSGWNKPKSWHLRRFRHNICQWTNQKGLCYYCQIPMTIAHPKTQPGSRDTTLEHLNPICLNGKDDESNIVLACSKCNNHRGSSSIEEFLKSDFLQYKREMVKIHQFKDFIPLPPMEAYKAFKLKYDHALLTMRSKK